jgi:hypothetical protein
MYTGNTNLGVVKLDDFAAGSLGHGVVAACGFRV